jgi:large subunit ribosomal protein L24
MPRHVRKGDTVMVTSGSFKGQVGEIIRVITKSDQVLVKGVNTKTKHVKPTRIAPQGGIITKEMPIHISKVSPVVDGKAVRVGFRTESDGSKVRVARHAGKELKVLGTIRAAAADAAPAKKASKASKKK